MGTETKVDSLNFESAVMPTLYNYDKLDYKKNYYVTNENDSFYDDIILMLQDSPISNQIINNTIYRIVGEGVFNKATGVKNDGLTKLLYKVATDYVYFNQFAVNLVWNVPHTTILDIKHLPIRNLRYTFDDKIVAVADNWSIRGKVVTPYQYFDVAENTDSDQVFYFKKYTVENRVYPLPYWWSTSKWIMIDKLIATGLLNGLNNNMTQSFILILKNGEPTEDVMRKITNRIKMNCTGQENNGGFMILSAMDSEHAPEIIPFPSNQNKENYEFINSLATKKIFQGFGVVSPILLGIDEGSQSLGNGTEMIAANDIFMNSYIIPKRNEILTNLNDVFKFSNINLDDYEVRNPNIVTEKNKELKDVNI